MSTRVPPKRSDELQEAGWTRRFTAMGRRLNEAVELYRQFGFEILLDAVELDDENTDGGEDLQAVFSCLPGMHYLHTAL